jgi:phosphoglycerate dehydrogenase-like enzyme
MLLSKSFIAAHGKRLDEIAQRMQLVPDVVHLPDDPNERLAAADLDRIEVAMSTRDIRFGALYKSFGDALTAAKNLKWAHFHSTAIEQHPFVAPLLARGVKLTTSAGTNGEPVAQTAIASLLMLARGFPHWLDAQRRKSWEPVRGAAQPPDLRGQTLLVVGMGNIGNPIAGFARALGMHVIGIRRRPRAPEDPVDEMHPLSELPQLLPRCDWVVLACPLTAETRRIINAQTLALMKKGAGLINVARGGVCDERAVIAALKSGQIACAHLDVFETEPLPADSPLWDMPNLILTPHNASASAGNDRRSAEMFLLNLEKWAKGEALLNPHTA